MWRESEKKPWNDLEVSKIRFITQKENEERENKKNFQLAINLEVKWKPKRFIMINDSNGEKALTCHKQTKKVKNLAFKKKQQSVFFPREYKKPVKWFFRFNFRRVLFFYEHESN